MANKDENGLIINGKKITAISGVVSFYYLRPKKEVYADGNGKYFPLIILLGDLHRSYEDLCFPCDCKLEDEKCCLKLYPFFIKFIDSLAYPVDFYTETFFEGTGTGFEGGIMNEMTTGSMITCYNPKLRNTKYDRCPTKNIRWQAGDSRQSSTLYYNKKTSDFPIKSYKYKKNLYIEGQLFELLHYIVSYNIIDKINLEDTCFINISNFKSLLLSLFSDNSDNSDDLDIKRFTDNFFSMMNENNSLIYKQVKKQTFRDFNEIEQWKDLYERSLKFNDIFYDKVKMFSPMIKKFIIELDNPNIQYNQVQKHIRSSNLKHLLYLISTSLLDIYVIARIFKQPKDGVRSDLSLCFFGNIHIININKLLLSTGAYELVTSVEVEKNVHQKHQRCTKLEDNYINLDRDLHLHNL
jgi:hypothetical protein